MMLRTGVNQAFEDMFAKHDIPVYNTARSWVLTCPNCGKHKKFYVERNTGYSICFSCGLKAGPAYAYSLVFSVPYDEAKDILSYGEYTPKDALPDLFPEEIPEEVEPDPVVKFGYGYLPLKEDDPAAIYGVKRGARFEDLVRLGCRWNEYQSRLVFPVYNAFGELVGWQGRDITGEAPLKSLSSPFKKGNHLMGVHLLKEGDPVAICEGPFDMLHIMAAGIPAVCTFGKCVTQRQIDLLLYLKPKRIFICLDTDAAVEAEELAMKIGDKARICLPVPYKDYGEMPIEEVRGYIKKGYKYNPLLTISEFLLS